MGQQGQNVTATIVDSLRAVMYEPHLYGKVDIGAGILADTDGNKCHKKRFS